MQSLYTVEFLSYSIVVVHTVLISKFVAQHWFPYKHFESNLLATQTLARFVLLSKDYAEIQPSSSSRQVRTGESYDQNVKI